MRFKKTFRSMAIFIGISVVSCVIVTYAFLITHRHYEKNIPLVGIIEDAGQRFDNQHAIVSVANDSDALEKVLTGIVSSRAEIQSLYDETTDEDTRILLKEILVRYENFELLTRTRIEAAATGMNAGDDDGELTAAGQQMQTSLQLLTDHYKQFTKSQSEVVFDWTIAAFVAVALSFTVFCVLIFRLRKTAQEERERNTKRLEEETKRVETLTTFIQAVSAGNYDLELTSSGDDNLTGTLVTMRDKLRQNADEDRKRNWSTQGLAQIGEILRSTTSNSTELYDNIIKFVVKYTRSTQGGLFALNDDSSDDQYLELGACYAFERKKYLQRRVEIGDGLVGQCFVEAERVYLVQVPDEYVNITSGLGGTTPRSVLLVPMKVNDKVYGVIELASFQPFEEYEIQLVEKLAETIASTISTVKVNETTRMLLEKTQQQTEEMKSQEEEIRQNMEELEATQEEMRRKQSLLEQELAHAQEQATELHRKERTLFESQQTLQAIIDNIPRAIFWKDKDLKFVGCNKIFARIAGVDSPADLLGKTDFDMAWRDQAEAYRKDDFEVMRSREGKLDIEELNTNAEGEESWVRTSKVPIITDDGNVVAILGMFEDITAAKNRDARIAQQLEERDNAVKELEALRQLMAVKK
ncbi:MAG TPA: GAF domain-containing protein [Chryseosolibacter sp.]|nr:GAF domain-containing protein [Chryseosolibacter sp.]